MKIKLSDKKCSECGDSLYEGSCSHCCKSFNHNGVKSDGITCTDCDKTIILYDDINVSKMPFWRSYWAICQCEHEGLEHD